MKKLVFFLLFFPSVLFSQIHFDLGVDGGSAFVFHKTDYQQTSLYNLYRFVAISFNDDFTFDEFKEVYGVQSYCFNPVFGVDGEIWHEKIPLFISTGVSTSPSTLQKPMFKGEIGIRKDFFLNNGWTIQGKTSFLYVIDKGFGTATIVNSVKNDVARNELKKFFVSKPVKQSGSLIRFETGIYKSFNNFSVGAGIYYNQDVTEQLKRYARMNVLGISLQTIFNL